MSNINIFVTYLKPFRMQTFNFDYPVTFADIDSGYHITPNAVLCYFQDAIARFLTIGDAGPQSLSPKGLLWVITEFHAEISETRPQWPDIVTVTVWFSEISSLKVHVDYLMKTPDGHLFANGTSTWLIMDSSTRRPFPCREVGELMALYDPDPEYRTPKFLFDASGEQIRTVTHRVTASDIDFNGHVSNQIYVRLASAMASSDYAGKHVIRELHVKFEKECFLDNVLEMTLYRKDDGSFATVIRREDMPEPVCRIISRWDECNQ